MNLLAAPLTLACRPELAPGGPAREPKSNGRLPVVRRGNCRPAFQVELVLVDGPAASSFGPPGSRFGRPLKGPAGFKFYDEPERVSRGGGGRKKGGGGARKSIGDIQAACFAQPERAHFRPGRAPKEGGPRGLVSAAPLARRARVSQSARCAFNLLGSSLEAARLTVRPAAGGPLRAQFGRKSGASRAPLLSFGRVAWRMGTRLVISAEMTWARSLAPAPFFSSRESGPLVSWILQSLADTRASRARTSGL